MSLGSLLLISQWHPMGRATAAEATGTRHVHHFFNARLLASGEAQVSMFGNAKFGVSPNLELGIQGLGYLMQGPAYNLAVKHQMFQGEGFVSSFNSHSFFLPSEYGSLSGFLSLHGFVTTLDLSPKTYFNFGLYDLYIYLKDESEDTVRGHVLAPMIGLDYYVSPRQYLTFIWVQPAYAFAQANTDFGDIESEVDLVKSGIEKSRFVFVSTTFAWSRFHLEPGVFVFGESSSYYLNLFWRFHAH